LTPTPLASDEPKSKLLRDKLLGLAAFRLAIAAVVLAAIVSGTTFVETGLDVYLRIAVIGLFSTALVHAVALWFGLVSRASAYAQVILDTLAMTVVVWFTGGAASPFAFLFCVVVIEAAGALSARGTVIVAALAATMLTGTTLFLAYHRSESVLPVITPLIAQVAAVLAVATLSAALVSETMRARLRLERTQSQLDRFSDLHERSVFRVASFR
jgi:hypothetical protein